MQGIRKILRNSQISQLYDQLAAHERKMLISLFEVKHYLPGATVVSDEESIQVIRHGHTDEGIGGKSSSSSLMMLASSISSSFSGTPLTKKANGESKASDDLKIFSNFEYLGDARCKTVTAAGLLSTFSLTRVSLKTISIYGFFYRTSICCLFCAGRVNLSSTSKTDAHTSGV